MQRALTKKFLNDLSYKVIGAAIEVHKILGPGLLESVYHKCMAHELKQMDISYQIEMTVPVIYKDIRIVTDLRCDFYIENCLLVELKAVEKVIPIYEGQLLSYMNLMCSPKGILINFHCFNLFRDGQHTYVNDLFKALPDL